jgi:hypothetical protein
MTKGMQVLSGLTIRGAIVREGSLGNIVACDLEKEEQDIPHAFIIKWDNGEIFQTEVNYDAHSICFVEHPENALVFISAGGDYGIHHASGSTGGEIFENSRPQPGRTGYVGFREVTSISGQAYAVGYRGMVYRLDQFDCWTQIDHGLPTDFEIESIHGFGHAEIYAAGDNGALWLYDGRKWINCELPTDVNLNDVCCAGDGAVYVSGDDGVLLRGRYDRWEIAAQQEDEEALWGVEHFADAIYVASIEDVYRLINDELAPEEFGEDVPGTMGQLSATHEELWSIGEYDIMACDGRAWRRII